VFFDKDILTHALTTLSTNNEITQNDVDSFNNRAEFAGFDGKVVTILANSPYYRDRLSDKLKKKLERILSEFEGINIVINFEVNQEKQRQEIIVPAGDEQPPVKKSGKPKALPKGLLPENNFDTFVAGENSEFAFGVAKKIAEKPNDKTHNPCFIYGGVGLGKTHLLQAIGNQIYHNQNDAKIIYITGREIYEDISKWLLNPDHKKNNVRQKYTEADVLLIDDVHVLEGKTATQDMLYHVFDELQGQAKPIVFTSDRAITELKKITPRLLSRFGFGIMVDLQPPNFETKVAIINKKLQLQERSLSSEVIEFIATNVKTNVRDLESTIKTLLAYNDITGKNITTEIARNQLKAVLQNSSAQGDNTITIDLVQKVVSSYFNITPGDLKSKGKRKSIVYPRQLAMYIIREITEYSTSEIGREFGGREHATVLHACEKIEKLKVSLPETGRTIQSLIRAVHEANSGL